MRSERGSADGRKAAATPALPFFAAACALALYVRTLAPGLLWSDSAKHLVFVAERDFLGFGHGRHPLHTLAGMLFATLPLPLPYSQNLLSAVAGAVAIGLVAAAAARLVAPLAALLAALALAVSHTVWLWSVVNETYSLLWACLAGALLLALRRRDSGSARDLVLLGLVSGLALSAHAIGALALPGLWLLALRAPRRIRPGEAAAALAALAVGSALLWLPALVLPAPPGAREGVGLVRSTIEHARLFLRPGRLPREILLWPAYVAFQLPSAALLALVLGARSLARQDRALLVALAAAVFPIVVFAAGYIPQREFPMLGATYVLLAPLVACGLEPLVSSGTRARALLTAASVLLGPPALYAAAAALAAARGLPLAVRALPFRDEARYFLWPPKRDVRGAERYVAAARTLLPPGSTVVADFNPGEPLRYTIDVEKGLDLRLLEVVDDFVLAGGDPGPPLAALVDGEIAAGHDVYLADRWEPYYRTAFLRERFDLEDVGPFVRVRAKARAQPQEAP